MLDYPDHCSRRTILATLAGGTAAVLVAACTPASPAAPTAAASSAAPASKPAAAATQPATAAPAQTTAPVKVDLGFVQGIFDAAYLLGAQDAGVYEKYGVDLNLQYIQDDITATKAIIAGEMLTAEISPGRPLVSISEGSKLKVVGVTYAKLPFVMLARKEITSFKDLAGKNVGIAAPGDLTQQIELALFRKEGLADMKVNFVQIGPTPQQVQALVAGKIDAGTGLFVHEILLRGNPDVHVLADVSQALPNLVRFTLAVRQEDIDKNDATLRKFMIAESAAWRWALENRDAVIQAAVKHLKLDEKVAAGAYDAPLTREGMITPDFTLTADQMQQMQEMNIAAGSQRVALPFEQVADLRYVKAIAEALGPFKMPAKQS